MPLSGRLSLSVSARAAHHVVEQVIDVVAPLATDRVAGDLTAGRSPSRSSPTTTCRYRRRARPSGCVQRSLASQPATSPATG